MSALKIGDLIELLDERDDTRCWVRVVNPIGPVISYYGREIEFRFFPPVGKWYRSTGLRGWMSLVLPTPVFGKLKRTAHRVK